jgi:mannose/cellobiose epimerase-like protein (N-acyl-D-glucosamine 2-epimerase family)
LSAAIVEELTLIWVCCGWLTTALHVSGVTITHLQEHQTTVTTTSGNRYTVLLSAAIVEELELIWVCCGWLTTALHVSDVTITHLQEHKTSVTTVSGRPVVGLLLGE